MSKAGTFVSPLPAPGAHLGTGGLCLVLSHANQQDTCNDLQSITTKVSNRVEYSR